MTSLLPPLHALARASSTRSPYILADYRPIYEGRQAGRGERRCCPQTILCRRTETVVGCSSRPRFSRLALIASLGNRQVPPRSQESGGTSRGSQSRVPFRNRGSPHAAGASLVVQASDRIRGRSARSCRPAACPIRG